MPRSLELLLPCTERITHTLLVFMGWGTDKQSDAELVEVFGIVYELGVVGINTSGKGKGLRRNFFKTLSNRRACVCKAKVQLANPKEPLF